MEFKFNVSEIFPGPIVEVNQNLIPPGFTGDRRALWDAVTKVSEVVNAMGNASAAAQGLTKPITTADRLRNSEQTIYLLVDRNAKNGKGVVTGMLKTGKKSLYVFDRDGHHYQVSPPCVLDFYVHESRQRTGLGKQLFEHMLRAEKVEPVKMAVDRPSEKLLSFLDKHYSLNNALRQMNNYVVFDGFFPETQNQSVNGDGSTSGSPSKTKAANGLQPNFTSPYGRYGAPRPPCSMGQIIHNQSPVQSNEPSGVSLNQVTKGVTQSMPAIHHQQQFNSNQGQGGVCQSSPNVAYQQAQTQPLVAPNMTCYGDSTGTPQQQHVLQQQPNTYPYLNTQHQHMDQNQHPHTHHNSVSQNQYPNVQNPQLNTQNQQLNLQNQQLGTTQYEQHMHQHQNLQQYQQGGAPQQRQSPIKHHQPNNGILPDDDEQKYYEELYMTDPYHTDREERQEQVVSQPNMPTHPKHIKHQSIHQMGHNISQPHFARPASSHSAVSTQYQQIQATHHEQPQLPANYATTMALQRGGGTGVHQHMVTSPQVAPTHQMIHPQRSATYQESLTPQQPLLSQYQVSSTAPAQHHVHSQQMVASQQSVASQQVASPQQIAHSHHHIYPQQMISSEPSNQFMPPKEISPQLASTPLHTVHSHHHMHPQTVPPQQDVASQSSQQIASQQQVTPSQHTVHPNHHHHEHPQQMVSLQGVPSELSQPIVASHEISLPQQVASPQYATQSHHHHIHPEQAISSSLQTAQPQSTPTIASVQHHLTQLQSMPALQPAQGNVQYQQYIQPPNTEQPVQAKRQFETAPETNTTAGQNVPFVPYQYYDSSSAKMQTVYLQPHGSFSQTAPSVHSTQQIPNAAGDTASIPKSPGNYQGEQNSIGSGPLLEEMARPQSAVHRPYRKVQQDTVGSLLQGQSGQMSAQRMQQQGQPFNGPQIASQ